MSNLFQILRWAFVLLLAWVSGKLITKIKMPAILGWLIAGMFLGPYSLGILSAPTLSSGWYKITITWMQCAFGLMLGTELVWKKLKSYGRAAGACRYRAGNDRRGGRHQRDHRRACSQKGLRAGRGDPETIKNEPLRG